MDERVTEAVSHIDDALEKCHGSATGWEYASDFVHIDSDSGSKPSPGLVLKGSLALPDAFISMFGQVRVKSFMGLFPSINRAWLTIDTRLFLWAYSIDTIFSHNCPHGNYPTVQTSNSADDFIAYDGFDQVILAVELVHPRPGVFSSDVKYLLAVATSVEVSLLGITFTGPNCTGDIRLVPTGYTVATDNVLMVKISSSPDGRIFMAGDDGYLHEFVYSGEDPRWMLGLLPSSSKKAYKTVYSSKPIAKYFGASLASYFSQDDELVDLVIDSSRNSLYTLSQRGSLTVYDMSNRERLRSVKSISVAFESRNMVSLSIPSTEREYVAIFPITPNVSSSIHLVVVTSFGERIYFSTQADSRVDSRNHGVRIPSASSAAHAPKTLTCVGYRPTPIRDTLGDSRPCIHMAWWSRGCLVMADLKDKQSDQLLSVFPDSRLGSRDRNVSLSGRSHAVEVVYESLDVGDEGAGFSMDQSEEPIRTFAFGEFSDSVHDLSSTCLRIPFEPPQLFWVLTSRRLHLYERTEPLQILHDLILSNRGSSGEVLSVFQGHGLDDLCAMSLRLAIDYPNLSAAAAQIFYGFGDQSAVSIENRNPNRADMKEISSTQPGGSNTWNSQMKDDDIERDRRDASSTFKIGRPTVQWTSSTNFSDVHRGTCLYISQIVYPIWLLFITNNRDPLGYQGLNLPRERIIEIRDQLLGLVAFFDKFNPEHMLNASARNNRLSSRAEMSGNQDVMEESNQYRTEPVTGGVDAHRIESASIESLKALSDRCAQALTLLLLLCEQQFHRLVASMNTDFKEILANLRFRELVTRREGVTVSQALLRSLFSCFPVDGYPKMQIVQILREQCYLYYGTSDESLHQGLALLRGAVARVKELSMRVADMEDRAIMPGWRTDNLDEHDVMSEARESIRIDAEKAANSLKQAVDRIFDMEQIFEDFREIGELRLLIDVALAIGQDREKQDMMRVAEIAYDAVIDTLEPLIREVNENAMSDTNESFDKSGNMDPAHIKRLGLKDTCLQTALTSTSSMFLQKLFGKLAQSSAGEVELLQLRSKDVENFLVQHNNSELLWRYYSKHGKYFDAAVILWKLADTEERNRLVERISNLSNSLHNAQAAVRSADPRAEPLVAEISDYLDVARVQLRLLNELKLWKSALPEGDTALASLDDRIMDLSTLYNNYAKPLCLYEGSLDALRCGSYRDDPQVQYIWRKLLEREANAASHMPALVFEKLVSIGKSFYPCNFVFPVKYVVDLFERYAFQKAELTAWANEPHWSSNLMMEIGVPVSDIAASYQQMIENALQRTSVFTDDFDWSDEKALLHIMSATEYCLRKWVGSSSILGNAVTSIDYHQRGWLSEREKALRATSLCKARLRGMAGSHASSLLHSFETLESELRV